MRKPDNFTFGYTASEARDYTNSMASSPSPPHGPQLLFSKVEWDAAMPTLTADMTDFVRPYRTPVFIDRGDHGDGWGSGSFVEFEGRKYLLTNQHVATVRHSGERLGVRYHGQDDLVVLMGDHVEADWPWDLALIPVSADAWSSVSHVAKAITTDQIGLAQTSFPAEVFAFSGYAADSDDAAHPFRDDRAHHSEMMPPTRGVVVGGLI